MKIYVGHSREFDYVKELYLPLRNSKLNSLAEIIFPHEKGGSLFNSKEDLKSVDFMIAEVSYPSTGLGIEIGYASIYKIPIIVVYQSGLKVSDSTKSLGAHIIEYSNSNELIEQIKFIVSDKQK